MIIQTEIFYEDLRSIHECGPVERSHPASGNLVQNRSVIAQEDRTARNAQLHRTTDFGAFDSVRAETPDPERISYRYTLSSKLFDGKLGVFRSHSHCLPSCSRCDARMLPGLHERV